MRWITWAVIALLYISFVGCVKWNLEKFEIVSFRKEVSLPDYEIGANPKNGILQTTSSEYWILGNTANDSILLTIMDEEALSFSSRQLGPGKGHSIIQLPTADSNYVAVATTSDNALLLWLDKGGSLLDVDSLKSQVNSELGLVEQVIAYDLLYSTDGKIIIVGAVRQSIGGNRLLIMQMDPAVSTDSLTRIQTYTENTFATSIDQLPNGDYVLAGFRNDQNIVISYLQSDLVFKWQNVLSNTIFSENAEVVVGTDGRIYTIGTEINANNDPDPVIYCLNPENGDEIWRKDNLFAFSNGAGYDLSLGTDNTLLVLSTQTADNAFFYYHLTKMGYDGSAILFSQSYPEQGSKDERPMSVLMTNDEGFLMFGLVNNDGIYSYRVIKTDAEGVTR